MKGNVKRWCAALIKSTDSSVIEKSKSLKPLQRGETLFKVGEYEINAVEGEDLIQLNCTCKYWRWQGPEYWAKEGGYLLGAPTGSASKPNVRDTKGNHFLCKHTVAVLSDLKSRLEDPRTKRASMVERVLKSFEKRETK